MGCTCSFAYRKVPASREEELMEVFAAKAGLVQVQV
jgi:hypothetical protein